MTTVGENGAVVITNNDLYIQLRKLEDAVLAMTPQAQQLSDHETRVRSLEKWKYSLPASLIVSLSSIIIAILEGTHGK